MTTTNMQDSTYNSVSQFYSSTFATACFISMSPSIIAALLTGLFVSGDCLATGTAQERGQSAGTTAAYLFLPFCTVSVSVRDLGQAA